MSALIAPDKFKGTLTAAEVAEAIARGLSGPAEICPLADGGDGTAEVLLAARGGEWIEASAHDALGEPISARFALLAGGCEAVVDVAEASGLARLAGRELDPLRAGSEGTGELIAAALQAGAERVILACGGSATTDAGLGALDRFDLSEAEVVCLCDVGDSFMGALRYAPQKGAGAEDLPQLEARLERVRGQLPHDPSRLPFTGAAGGLAGGFWAHGAKLVPGADYVLRTLEFDRRLESASLLISGEGRVDPTSLSGKAVGEVARRARRHGVPCHLIVGEDGLGPEGGGRFSSVQVAGTVEAITQAASRIDNPG